MVGTTKKPAPRRHKIWLPRDWPDVQPSGPSCGYVGDHMPFGAKLKYLTGIIMSIPIMGMEIPFDDSANNEHDRLAKLLEDGGWQYNFDITED